MTRSVLGIVILVLVAAASLALADDPQIDAVRGLINRVVGSHDAVKFELALIKPSAGNTDEFTVESVGSADQIKITGSSGVALASGFNWFLQNRCNSSVSWLGDNIKIPKTLPRVTPAHKGSTTLEYRYYFNVCTFGYTTVWWDWQRWEKEIDWMALNGVNTPLAFTGQEYVWQRTFEELGLPLSELDTFFSGPAFLPWERMGNLDGWFGPLSQHWISSHRDLQKQILARQRAFGMRPVLPGFAGHVPASLKTRYPSANITKLNPWNGFNGTFFLNPIDPLFQTIGSTFIRLQAEEYGGQDHLYNADPFNELNPPSSDPAFLANVSRSIYRSMQTSDKDAIWVLQGWFLYNEDAFWRPPQAKAFLTAVPTNSMLVLDLYAEVSPVYNQTDNFYGQPFVWNELNNFGGRTGLYGTLPRVNEGPFIARKAASNMKGIGMTPEALENNLIAFALLTDSTWRSAPVNLDAWVDSYVLSRYGQTGDDIRQSWRLLQNSVFNCWTKQHGTSGSILAARPSLNVKDIGGGVMALYYNPENVTEAARLMLQFSKRVDWSWTVMYDSAATMQQVYSNDARAMYYAIVDSFNKGDINKFNQLRSSFLQIFGEVERLLDVLPLYRLRTWVNDARAWGNTKAEKDWLERNAKTQLTLWGGRYSELHDYAYKIWSGLVAEFYHQRWVLFLDALHTSLVNRKPFDAKAFEDEVTLFEYQWTQHIGDERAHESDFNDEDIGAKMTTLIKLSEHYLLQRQRA